MTKEKTAYIYTLSDPETGLVRYVGKTCQPKQRLYSHQYYLAALTYKKNWIRSLKEKGLKPIMEILEEHPNSDIEAWRKAEAFYITYFKFLGCELTNASNLSIGGLDASEESRRKVSESKLGKPRPRHVIEAMRKANIGRKPSPETIERLKNRPKRFGYKHTKEVIEKIKTIKIRRWYKKSVQDVLSDALHDGLIPKFDTSKRYNYVAKKLGMPVRTRIYPPVYNGVTRPAPIRPRILPSICYA